MTISDKTPLVSVCLPNLNTCPFLEERIETVFKQTLGDWELIISDNYSNDGSWELFQKYKNDPRVRLSQAPREGMYANWNACLKQARGKYIYMATSDDTMDPACLERLAGSLEQQPDLKIAVCDFQEIDEQSRPVPRKPKPHHLFLGEWLTTPSIRNGRAEFLLHAAFGTTIWSTMTSVLFRRDLLEKVGLFRRDLGSRADEEWTLRASLASDIAFIPDKLATWRVHSTQATGRWANQRQAVGWLLESINSVLRDENAGIPEAWKKVPHWQQLIAAYQIQQFQLTFRLFRWELKNAPGKFLRDLVTAPFEVPEWFFQQLGRGFSWSDSLEIDTTAHASKLIKLFDAAWPPGRANWK